MRDLAKLKFGKVVKTKGLQDKVLQIKGLRMVCGFLCIHGDPVPQLIRLGLAQELAKLRSG
jgi:hypothetical protein